MKRSDKFLQGAWITISRLFGGLILGILLGMLAFQLIPGSSVENPSPVHASLSAVPALAGLLTGGAAWGTALAKLAGLQNTRKAATAGLLGFGPVAFVMVVGLGMLEPQIAALVGPAIPIHRLFTILFTISAFLISGASVLITIRLAALGDHPGKTALRVALSAAGAFLLVNLAMEAFGWVVGAPGAANRATMLVVMFLGNLAAAFVGGGLLALGLAPQEPAVKEA